MGREVRMVPRDWEHPKNEQGRYIALLGSSYTEALNEWEEGGQKWTEGFRRNWFAKEGDPIWVSLDDDEKKITWEHWSGGKPLPGDFMPEWEEEEKTHFQMYENDTEGTPKSPPMESPELLAKWLADNNASAFGGLTATYEQWLNTIMSGYAPSAIITNMGLDSGVALS